ncbi:ROK family protein [Flavobacterium sp. LC2016-12]|uniref:ROK family protein n=1 Tax=Flavobacterium sp. LC2016-12 TaxID=2783794 RepID=UPI00188D966F|nr:ROK family protein [Flavobacterium sp. LC2016-12]MBF4466280.1 ROK family protein [Flavobacterium sp. LC2016-12]
MPIIIGVDIGGSHISSAAVNQENLEIVNKSYFRGFVDSKASKEIILQKWAEIINKTLAEIDVDTTVGIAFSMPGPFHYETGIAMFEGNDKYESLYNVNIPLELARYLNNENVAFRFLNDATSFGIGSALHQKDGGVDQKVIAITLGTGFGASFLNDIIPVINGDDVPQNGCLWDKPFKSNIADDYFSTRWFLRKYEEYSGKKSSDGVKEIASIKNEYSTKIFDEFAANLSEFLLPYILEFKADSLVIGGNIAKCSELFLPKVLQKWKENGVELSVIILENTEESSIIGSSYMFNEVFWNKIKEQLPNF